jgi:hypothetical protein
MIDKDPMAVGVLPPVTADYPLGTKPQINQRLTRKIGRERQYNLRGDGHPQKNNMPRLWGFGLRRHHLH